MLPGARILPYPASTADKILGTGLWIVTGWSFKETTGGAAASLRLLDGRDVNGQPFAEINLAAGESTRDLTAPNGIACQVGVFVDRISGSIEGAVWAVPGEVHHAVALARGLHEAWYGTE